MSFPRYPNYKDSGVEWLGEVPEHWETSRMKNLFSLMKRLPLEGDEIVTAFRDGEVTLRSNRRIDGFTNAIQEHGYQRIQKNDLVIHAMDAFAGAIGVSDSDGKSTPVYSVCTPKTSTVNPHYYGRLMRHMALSGYINSLSKGIRERSTEFRWNEAAKVILAVPPLAEQTRIVGFLDRETAKIDGLIEEQQRLMELLNEKRRAVISHAVTKGLNPRAPMKPSGIEWLGDVPQHWRLVPFPSAIKFQEGPGIMAADFHEEGIPLLRVSGVQGRWATLEGCNYLDPEKVKIRWEHFRVVPGDLLISASASMGTVCEVGPETAGAVPYTGLIRLVANNGAIKRDYIRAILGSALFLTQVDLLKAGATIQHFGPTHLRQMDILLPPLDEQEQITVYINKQNNSFDALAAEAQSAIDLLQERRSALISAAVTGQIDVRQIAATVPA